MYIPFALICLLLLDRSSSWAQTQATLLYPQDWEPIADAAPTLQWTNTLHAQAYYLYVGSAAGAKDLFDSGEIVQTAFRVVGLPLGPTIYVRLWTKADGIWRFADSRFNILPISTFIYPAPAGVTIDPSQPWRWTSLANAQAYYLYVGTTPGTNNLVNSGEIQQPSFLPANLPIGAVFTRLWVKVAGIWRYTDSTFTVPGLARLAYPVNGSTTADFSQAARWTEVTGAEAYYLYVGSAVGAKNLVDTGEIHQTSYFMSNLPKGQLLFARLWIKHGGVWRYSDSSFASPAVLATITHPPDRASGVDFNRPYTWTAAPNAQAYYLYVGSSPGAKDFVNSGELQQTSYSGGGRWYQPLSPSLAWAEPVDSSPASGFAMILDGNRIDLGLPSPLGCADPTDTSSCYEVPMPSVSGVWHAVQVSAYNEFGEAANVPVVFTPGVTTAYIRLWTKIAGTWRYVDSSFTPAKFTPEFIYPAYGISNVDVTKALSWTAVPGADAYSLSAGLAPGGRDLLDVAEVRATSYLAAGLASLPPNRRAFVRLGARVQGVWRYTNTMFGTLQLASLTFPGNGSAQVPRSTCFYWTGSVGVQAYYLYVGTTAGAKDVINSWETSSQSYCANTLPGSTTLYARLWTKLNGTWRFVDSQFVTEP